MTHCAWCVRPRRTPVEKGSAALTSELADLVKSAREFGWASGTMTRIHILYQASQLGWVEVATRKGADTIVELRPTTTEEANPSSLSAVHGLGEQPLHTDGAHLLEPPDVVVLYAEQPNDTPTLLRSLSLKPTSLNQPRIASPSGLRGGLFLVRSGSDRFLASARTDVHGYRYDPGCMTPCDERAREAVRYFEEAQANAHQHEWTEPHQLLVIDNRTALHGRAAVSGSDVDRVLTRIAYRTKVEK